MRRQASLARRGAFGGERLSAKLTGGTAGKPDGPAHRSSSATSVREGVRVALAKCEAIFRLQEPKKRMRDQAAHACRALCRARVAEELQRVRLAGDINANRSARSDRGDLERRPV